MPVVLLILAIVLLTDAVDILTYEGAVCGKLCDAAFMEEATPEDIRKLLAEGADVNARNKDDSSPLHWAVFNENPEIIATLIEAGANVNARIKDGYSPLHFAAVLNKNPAVIKALAQAGADVNARTKDGWSPLHFAAENNKNSQVIRALVQAGADVNARDKDEETPLHQAAERNKNPEVVLALLDAGADADAKTTDGKTALDLIKENGALINTSAHQELVCGKLCNREFIKAASLDDVEKSIEAGADVNARNSFGYSPLHLAVGFNNNPAVITALIEARAKVNAQTDGGYSPLHWAAWNNDSPAVIKVLVQAGADVNAQTAKESSWVSSPFRKFTDLLDGWHPPMKGGWSPLHYAARFNENPEVALKLLDDGADANAKTDDGKTALNLIKENDALKYTKAHRRLHDLLTGTEACGELCSWEFMATATLENINELLTKEVVNARDKHGWSPLHTAALLNKNPKVIEALIKAGADLDARDKDGKSPLNLAEEAKNDGIARILRDELHWENIKAWSHDWSPLLAIGLAFLALLLNIIVTIFREEIRKGIFWIGRWIKKKWRKKVKGSVS